MTIKILFACIDPLSQTSDDPGPWVPTTEKSTGDFGKQFVDTPISTKNRITKANRQLISLDLSTCHQRSLNHQRALDYLPEVFSALGDCQRSVIVSKSVFDL